MLYQILVFLSHRKSLQLAQSGLITADFPQRRLSRSHRSYLILAVPGQFLQMGVPTLQIVFLPNLFNDSQGKQLGIELGKSALFQELPSFNHDIILEELYQGVIDAILAEDNSASEVKIEESNESGMLHFEVHGLENSSLCLFVFLLTERLISITLISVQIRHILIQFNSLSSNDQCRTRPKLLTRVQFLQSLVDV